MHLADYGLTCWLFDDHTKPKGVTISSNDWLKWQNLPIYIYWHRDRAKYVSWFSIGGNKLNVEWKEVEVQNGDVRKSLIRHLNDIGRIKWPVK